MGEGAWYLAVEGALVLRAEGAVQPLVARRWGGVELALTNTHEEEFFWTNCNHFQSLILNLKQYDAFFLQRAMKH